MVYPEDVPWLVDWVRRAEEGAFQQFLARVVLDAYREGDVAGLDLIMEAGETCPAIRQTFAPVLEPIEINSAAATQLRQNYQQHQAWQGRHAQRRTSQGPPPA